MQRRRTTLQGRCTLRALHLCMLVLMGPGTRNVKPAFRKRLGRAARLEACEPFVTYSPPTSLDVFATKTACGRIIHLAWLASPFRRRPCRHGPLVSDSSRAHTLRPLMLRIDGMNDGMCSSELPAMPSTPQHAVNDVAASRLLLWLTSREQCSTSWTSSTPEIHADRFPATTFMRKTKHVQSNQRCEPSGFQDKIQLKSTVVRFPTVCYKDEQGLRYKGLSRRAR